MFKIFSDKNKPRNTRFIIILLVVSVLWATNPNLEDFSEYLVNQASKESDSALAIGIFKALGPNMVKAVTIRDDYGIFSIFTFHDGKKKTKVVGMLNGIFFGI